MNHSRGTGENLKRIASKYKKRKFIHAHHDTAWDGSQIPPIVMVVKETYNAWVGTAGSDITQGKAKDYV